MSLPEDNDNYEDLLKDLEEEAEDESIKDLPWDCPGPGCNESDLTMDICPTCSTPRPPAWWIKMEAMKHQQNIEIAQQAAEVHGSTASSEGEVVRKTGKSKKTIRGDDIFTRSKKKNSFSILNKYKSQSTIGRNLYGMQHTYPGYYDFDDQKMCSKAKLSAKITEDLSFKDGELLPPNQTGLKAFVVLNTGPLWPQSTMLYHFISSPVTEGSTLELVLDLEHQEKIPFTYDSSVPISQHYPFPEESIVYRIPVSTQAMQGKVDSDADSATGNADSATINADSAIRKIICRLGYNVQSVKEDVKLQFAVGNDISVAMNKIAEAEKEVENGANPDDAKYDNLGIVFFGPFFVISYQEITLLDPQTSQPIRCLRFLDDPIHGKTPEELTQPARDQPTPPPQYDFSSLNSNYFSNNSDFNTGYDQIEGGHYTGTRDEEMREMGDFTTKNGGNYTQNPLFTNPDDDDVPELENSPSSSEFDPSTSTTMKSRPLKDVISQMNTDNMNVSDNDGDDEEDPLFPTSQHVANTTQSNAPWSCKRCTYENGPLDTTCLMCENDKE